MKSNVDIDVTDPKKLVRARAELWRLLEIVDFALGKYGHTHHSSQGQVDLAIHTPNNSNGSKPNIREVIAALPSKFTTTDVIIGLGTEGKDNRARAKMVLSQEEKRGHIRITKAGQGRRPTEYEKVGE